MNHLRQRFFVRALEDRTVPATFTVLNLADSGPDSLRDCVSKANTTGGFDTVDFKAGLFGTIALTTGEIAISETVIIAGPGSTVVTISGNNASRIFNVSAVPAAALVSIADLRISGGGLGFGRSDAHPCQQLVELPVHFVGHRSCLYRIKELHKYYARGRPAQ